MSSASTIETLNRLYAIHHRSLPMYLRYAVPWKHHGNETASEILGQIVADQQRTVDRIGTLILDLKGDVSSGEFPMSFTGLHDLSLDYLIGQLIQLQQSNIEAIEACVEALQLNPLAKALAQEALGEARGHLDSLQELQPQHSSAE